jgi:hypothetical protein
LGGAAAPAGSAPGCWSGPHQAKRLSELCKPRKFFRSVGQSTWRGILSRCLWLESRAAGEGGDCSRELRSTSTWPRPARRCAGEPARLPASAGVRRHQRRASLPENSVRYVLRVVSGVRRRRKGGEQDKADRRRIPDTTTCTKPLARAYGDWFPACYTVGRHWGGVGLTWRAVLDGPRLRILPERGWSQPVPISR